MPAWMPLCNDAEILLEIAAAGKVTVIQVMGAQNLSNRFYRVHPRRNDRFLEGVRPAGSRSISEVDFTEFHFNRAPAVDAARRCRPDVSMHCARSCRRSGSRGCAGSAWQSADRAPWLLWLRQEGARMQTGPLGADPLMVTRDMLEQLKPDDGLHHRDPGNRCGPLRGHAGKCGLAQCRHRLPNWRSGRRRMRRSQSAL